LKNQKGNQNSQFERKIDAWFAEDLEPTSESLAFVGFVLEIWLTEVNYLG